MNTQSVTGIVIKLAQEVLLDHTGPITPAIVESKIDLVLSLQPEWVAGLNRAVAAEELMRRARRQPTYPCGLPVDSDHICELD